MNILTDEDLSKVQGGAVNWQLFSQKFLKSVTSITTITQKHKELINAIKQKDYNQVSVLAISLIPIDPVVAQIVTECDNK